MSPGRTSNLGQFVTPTEGVGKRIRFFRFSIQFNLAEIGGPKPFSGLGDTWWAMAYHRHNYLKKLDLETEWESPECAILHVRNQVRPLNRQIIDVERHNSGVASCVFTAHTLATHKKNQIIPFDI